MVDRSGTPAHVTTLPIPRGSGSPLHDANAPETLDGLPLMLSVDEAAHVLRISRTTAYKLVALHQGTGGQTGLPHVRPGSRLMIRRVDLAAIVGLQPAAG